MRKENNGQCREKNEKLCKVKTAGESDRTPFIDRTEYYNLSKNWRITLKLHFENLCNFLKKKQTYTYARSTPPPVRFCSLFNDPPSPPQQTHFLNDPYVSIDVK